MIELEVKVHVCMFMVTECSCKEDVVGSKTLQIDKEREILY